MSTAGSEAKKPCSARPCHHLHRHPDTQSTAISGRAVGQWSYEGVQRWIHGAKEECSGGAMEL